ncbi:MAG: IS1380 family transposase [bacterium]
MKRIQADLLPRIAQQWGQENCFYKAPFSGREGRWINAQHDLFRRMNPISACDNKKKVTPYNTRLYFNQRNLTGFGGMFLPIAFAERMGLDRGLESVLEHKGYTYSTSQLLISTLACILAGAPRLYDINSFRHDPGLTRALGVDQLPDEGNIRKQLAAATRENVDALERVNQKGLLRCNQTERVIEIGIDFDLTTATVYGKQEGAEIGYNPRKRGRPCFQIAAAFIANNRDWIKAELRPGNTHCTTDFESFFESTLAMLPPNYRPTFVRIDKGFFSEELFDYLEAREIRYICAAKATPDLKALARTLKDFRPLSSGDEEEQPRRFFITEIDYRYGSWSTYRRMIIVKEQEPNPDYDPQDRDLLGQPRQPEYLESYRFYVTDIGYEELDAESCWRFYNHRATVENCIKESKLGFNLDKLPSLNFYGNAFYVQLVVLAYNLLNWFKRFVLPAQFRSKSIRWLRMNLLLIPALVTRKKLQWFIKYPRGYRYRTLMEYIFRCLAEGKPRYVV